MILPVQFQADWNAIRARRQQRINQSNERENRSRIPHEHKVGDYVSRKRHGTLAKLRKKKDGPFVVDKVFANGTVVIRDPDGPVSERINI
jgi:hypothetical protein